MLTIIGLQQAMQLITVGRYTLHVATGSGELVAE
jgi:hypothetical protein